MANQLAISYPTLAHGARFRAAEQMARLMPNVLWAAVLVGCSEPALPPVPTDLAAILPLAEMRTETSEIDLGTAAGRRHLLEGWSDEETRGETSFVWGLGTFSALRLTILEPRPLELLLTGWPLVFPGAPEQTVEVVLNGQRIGELRLAPEWTSREHRIPLPTALQVRGDNRIELRYGHHQRPIDVIPGARDPRSLAAAWDSVRVLGTGLHGGAPRVIGEGRRSGLLIPIRTAVEYYFRLPAGGRLAFAEILPWDGSTGGSPGDAELLLRVTVTSDATPGEKTFELASRDRGADLSLPLPPAPDGPTRMTLETFSDRRALSERREAGLHLVGPTLFTALNPPDGEGHTDEQRTEWNVRADERPNVLVYLVDTLRADHLGCYGYQRPTSPHVDAFAREATLFSRMLAQSSWTRPAVASLFTGLYPQTHGTVSRHHALAGSLDVLPELLRRAGFLTAGIVTNLNVDERFGFGRGFEHYEMLAGPRFYEAPASSDEVNEAAFRWLQEWSGERPFFLYLHTWDPHDPYDPPSPDRERFAPWVRDPEIGSLKRIQALKRGEIQASSRLAEDLIALYDAEIAFNDRQFGRLLGKLRELDLYESTLIVFLSDHGEEFFDHGSWTHGRTLFEEQLRVPLIVKLPGNLGRGETVTEVARQIDLLPTILEAVGEPVPAGVQGRSLLPLIAHPETHEQEPALSYTHLRLDGQHLESVSVGGKKLIHYLEDRDGHPQWELYDLAEDRFERRSLAQQQPLWTGYLQSLLKRRRTSWRTPVEPVEIEIDAELRRQLEALGYVQ